MMLATAGIGTYLVWYLVTRAIYAYVIGRRWVAQACIQAEYEATRDTYKRFEYHPAQTRAFAAEEYQKEMSQAHLRRLLEIGPERAWLWAPLWPVYGDVALPVGAVLALFSRIAQHGIEAERRALISSGVRDANAGQISPVPEPKPEVSQAVAEFSVGLFPRSVLRRGIKTP